MSVITDNINDIESIPGIASVLAALRADRAGITFDFAGATTPTGSLECNGQVVLRASYPELYAAIGDLWATTGGVATPGVTEFRLPPQQIGGIGLFTRGKGAVGIGVYQADVFKAHNHTASSNTTGAHTHLAGIDNANGNNVSFTGGVTGNSVSNLSDYTGSSGNHSHTITVDSTGDATETRPRSITMMKCIWTGQ